MVIMRVFVVVLNNTGGVVRIMKKPMCTEFIAVRVGLKS